MTEDRKQRIKNIFYVSLIFLILIFPLFSVDASSDIEDALKRYLKDNYPWAEIGLMDIKFSEDVGKELLKRIIVEKGPPGRTVFWLEFESGKRITATAYVRAFDTVVLSRRPMPKGYVLQKEDIYTTTMDITRIPKGAVKNYQHIVGKPLMRTIVANIPLSENMVIDKPLVKKGQRVTIIAESPSFSIATVGETKETAFVGSHIKVINLTSKKIITGTLLDENTVKVDF